MQVIENLNQFFHCRSFWNW